MRRELNCLPKDVPIGAWIEEDIYDANNVLLCTANSLVDSKMYETLQRYQGVVHVVVEEETEIMTADDIEEDTTPEFSPEIKEQAVESLVFLFEEIDNPEVVTQAAENIADIIIDTIADSNSLGINLSKLKISDDYTYKHSLDVAAIGALMATKLGKDEDFVRDIAAAGVLHDIGKIKIPDEILNKPGKLTDEEFEVIKKHPNYGYEILMENPDINDRVKRAVSEHHENVDGTGYPASKRGDEISEMGKILAIADVYDALLTRRPYKRAKTPAETIEIMMSMINKFDLQLLMTFLNTVVAYPNGTVVALSNGDKCVVLKQNPGYPLRPVVMSLISYKTLDLATDLHCLSLTIQ